MNTKAIHPKFALGRVIATSNLLSKLPEDVINGTSDVLIKLLDRHVSGDWGEICAEDAALNDEALETGDRLLSAYYVTDSNGQPLKIWIITEADRSATTLLLPEDY